MRQKAHTMTMTPRRTFDTIQPGEHVCCIYATDDEQQAVLTAFLRQGLTRHEKALSLLDARTSDRMLGSLRADGVDVEDVLASGQLSILTQEDAGTRDRQFDPDAMIALLDTETAQAVNEGYAALRVTADMSWVLRGTPGADRVIEYDITLNTFLPQKHCLALCLYDRRRFPPRLLLDMLRAHPMACIGAEVYENLYYIPPEKLLGGDVAEIELEAWLHNIVNYARNASTLAYHAHLVQQVSDAIIATDLDLRITSWNAAAEQMYGWTEHEAVGQALDELLRTEFLRATRAQAQPQLLAQNSWTGELRQQDKHGRELYVLAAVSLLRDHHGSLMGGVTVNHDITERKRAEDALLKEMQALEYFSGTAKSAITSESFNLVPLHRAAPAFFQESVQTYIQAMKHALDEELYKVDHQSSRTLTTLGNRLGTFGAGPRDIVHLHMIAFKQITDELPDSRKHAYTDIGRMTLIKLLGYVLSCYRNSSLGRTL